MTVTQEQFDNLAASFNSALSGYQRLVVGSGAPAIISINGTYYFDQLTSTRYERKNNVWEEVSTGGGGGGGNTIISAARAPNNLTDGIDGDFFIDSSTYTIYGPKTASVWGAGTEMLADTILSGTGAPVAGLIANGGTGNVGDLYIDTASLIMYGPKGIDNSWPILVNLNVQDGADGNTILNGVGAPDDITDGNDGDFWIDTADWLIYGPKSGGAWPVTTENVKGSSVLNGTGAPVDGASGTGDNGDFYIDTSTLFIYGPKAGDVWPVGNSLVGTANTLLNGSGVPDDGSDGIDGDFYINTDTQEFYGPKAGGTWPSPPAQIGGNTVLNGSGAPNDVTDGKNGDFWIDTDLYIIYGPKTAGTWAGTPTASIYGNQLLNGIIDPDTGDGRTNDFYLNTTTNVLFGPKSGGGSWGAGVDLDGTGNFNWVIRDDSNDGETITPPANILVDTSTAAFTLLLPASPAVDDLIRFAPLHPASLVTNPLTIDSNTQPIEGSIDNIIVDEHGASFALLYSGATDGWVVLNDTEATVIKTTRSDDLWTIKGIADTGTTLTVGEASFIDTSGGALNFTMPAGVDGLRFKFAPLNATTFTDNSMTLTPQAGERMNAVVDDQIAVSTNTAFDLIYIDDGNGWVAIGRGDTQVIRLSGATEIGDLNDVVSGTLSGASTGDVLQVNAFGLLESATPITTFLGLAETPSAFAALGADANKLVTVNGSGTGLVFSTNTVANIVTSFNASTQTADFTAASGTGYDVGDNGGSSVVINAPASPVAGDEVIFAHAGTQAPDISDFDAITMGVGTTAVLRYMGNTNIWVKISEY